MLLYIAVTLAWIFFFFKETFIKEKLGSNGKFLIWMFRSEKKKKEKKAGGIFQASAPIGNIARWIHLIWIEFSY